MKELSERENGLVLSFSESGFADSKFLTQKKENPSASLAEAKVWNFLKKQGQIHLEKGSDKGPDFGFLFNNSKIWLEVTTPELTSPFPIVNYEKGQDFSSGFISDALSDPYCVQLLGSLRKKILGVGKDKGRKQYVESDKFAVKDLDPYIVALSNQYLLLNTTEKLPSNLPIIPNPIFKVCWGVTSEQVIQNDEVRYKVQEKVNKKKKNLDETIELDLGIFNLDEYLGLSAVLFCDHRDGEESYMLLHNHNAKNPILFNIFTDCEHWLLNGDEVYRLSGD